MKGKMCVIAFGLKKRVTPKKQEREKQERKTAEKLVGEMQEGGSKWDEEIEELHRNGKYVEGHHPLKIRFMSQAVVEEVLAKT